MSAPPRPATAHATPSAERAAAEFTRRFGRAPLGVWSAPGRVNLIGEHTDYNDGFALPFAIDRRTWAAVAPREDRRIRVASTFAGDKSVELPLGLLDPARLAGWSAYPLGVAWAFGRLAARGGVDVCFDSSVPVGAGLSSSAAIEASIAIALNELWGTNLDRSALARIGRLAENEAVGAPTGIMDQTAALQGTAGAAVLLDARTLHTRAVPLGFAAAGLEVLVIDTRTAHAHAGGGYGARRASCERAAQVLGVPALRDVALARLEAAEALLDDETFRRARHVLTENARVLAAVTLLDAHGDPARSGDALARDMRAIGALLDASHASLRDDFEVSTPELDLAAESARAAGALGARMTGGGFGGAVIALVPTAQNAAIAEAVTRAFAEAGYPRPQLFTVTPSAGARRER
ncbi:MAG TPA: galactokinase [Microbacteriaceae bacterium]|jgi:galactokinase|nr:galactokinase [Microbacteriaceae bacterium]HQC92941.1 galactokinase [Microbacteriaceae bacterium]